MNIKERFLKIGEKFEILEKSGADAERKFYKEFKKMNEMDISYDLSESDINILESFMYKINDLMEEVNHLRPKVKSIQVIFFLRKVVMWLPKITKDILKEDEITKYPSLYLKKYDQILQKIDETYDRNSALYYETLLSLIEKNIGLAAFEDFERRLEVAYQKAENESDKMSHIPPFLRAMFKNMETKNSENEIKAPTHETPEEYIRRTLEKTGITFEEFLKIKSETKVRLKTE